MEYQMDTKCSSGLDQRHHKIYEVGSRAYVKVSLVGDKYYKLTKRFYNPFKILAWVGQVAYKLELLSY